MKKYVLLLSIVLTLLSCNKESVKVKGKIYDGKTKNVELKILSVNEKCKDLSSSLGLDKGEMKTTIEKVKPPFKMTLIFDNEKIYETWVFRYGTYNFEITEGGILHVNNSIENTEYDRICKNYHKMYFKQIGEKEKWVQENEELEDMSEGDEEKLFNYRRDIKKAYKLRKKSVLSTFRKNPQNRIAMALLFDEYERLTTWQKEECLKNAMKYYSDCGINWQLKN